MFADCTMSVLGTCGDLTWSACGAVNVGHVCGDLAVTAMTPALSTGALYRRAVRVVTASVANRS